MNQAFSLFVHCSNVWFDAAFLTGFWMVLSAVSTEMWFTYSEAVVLLVLSSCSLLSCCLSFLWFWAMSVDMAVSMCFYVVYLYCFSK